MTGPGTVFDTVIVGGGPAGSSAAEVLAKDGHKVLILDSRERPGTPVNCGEAISTHTLEYSGLSRNGEWISGPTRGYRIRSPSGKDLYTPSEGFNIRRDLFDMELIERATGEGARFSGNSPVSDLRKTDDEWIVKTKERSLKARSLILACGYNPHLINTLATGPEPATMNTIGAKVDLRDDSEELLFHVRGNLKGGYGWYFPRGEEVNIGVVTPGDPVEDLSWIMKIHGIEKGSIRRYQGGILPVDGIRDFDPDIGAIPVGDAGGFVNPISKGGIIGALLSGKEGGKAISGYLSGEVYALSTWKKDMSDHPSYQQINIRRKDILASLDDRLLDDLTSIADGRNVWEIRRTEILKKAFKNPELRRIGKAAFKLAKGGREWAKWAF